MDEMLTAEEYMMALLDWTSKTTHIIGGENVPPSNEADTVVMLED